MKEIKLEDLHCNPFTLFDQDWCLIGAKHNGKFNAMTASWGGVGVIWNKNVATIYVRPQRYTKQFIDASDMFTLSFFSDMHKPALRVYGSVSGKDVDKEKETGLTLIEEDNKAYFKEAKLVFECKKLYQGKIEEKGFVDLGIAKQNYPEADYHYIYIGEITKVWEESNE